MRRSVVSCVAASVLLVGIVAGAPATASPSAEPAHEFAATATTGGGSAWVDAPQRYLDEVFPAITVMRDIPFATVTNYLDEEQTLLLDLYQPDLDASELRPAMVWMGGGSFRTIRRSSMGNWTTRSARRGYVAITIDYRVQPDLNLTDYPAIWRASQDAMHDAQAAVRWLRANAETYRIDPDRIMVGGYSAGAITSLWVNFGEERAELDGPNAGHPSGVRGAVSLAGAFGGAPVLGDPPITMFHGIKDTTVPYVVAKMQCDSQLAAGNICEWHEYDTAHGLPLETIYPLAFSFIYRHMSCGETFSDLPPLPSTFCGDIDWLVTNGLAQGYLDGTFQPRTEIQRQHLVAMLWRMAGSPTGAPDPGFADVAPNALFAEAIAWGVQEGIIKGFTNGTFKPAAPVTRAAATWMLWSMVGAPTGAEPASFTDVEADHLFAEAIAWAADAGVMLGIGDGTFQPSNPVTREVAAAQLHRSAPLLP